MLFVLDLDGVVWLSGRPIPGSPEAVARLRASGHRVVFLTNNSGPRLAQHVAALRKAGLDAEPGDVVTSAQAAASMVDPGQKVAAVGGPGIREALEERGAVIVPASASPAAVVVGREPVLDYDELAAAASAIRAGARYVATNTDPTFPTPEGLLPGAGALVAYLAVASGVGAEIAGKPHRPVARLIKDRFGPVDFVIGDRLDTDGAFAEAVGAPFGLVLSGVTAAAEVPADDPPAVVAADLARLVDKVLELG